MSYRSPFSDRDYHDMCEALKQVTCNPVALGETVNDRALVEIQFVRDGVYDAATACYFGELSAYAKVSAHSGAVDSGPSLASTLFATFPLRILGEMGWCASSG